MNRSAIHQKGRYPHPMRRARGRARKMTVMARERGLSGVGRPFGDIVAEDSGVAEELAHGETGREQPADDQQGEEHEGADPAALERVRGDEVEGAPGVPRFPLGPGLADHRRRGVGFEAKGGAQARDGVGGSPFACLHFRATGDHTRHFIEDGEVALGAAALEAQERLVGRFLILESGGVEPGFQVRAEIVGGSDEDGNGGSRNRGGRGRGARGLAKNQRRREPTKGAATSGPRPFGGAHEGEAQVEQNGFDDAGFFVGAPSLGLVLEHLRGR